MHSKFITFSLSLVATSLAAPTPQMDPGMSMGAEPKAAAPKGMGLQDLTSLPTGLVSGGIGLLTRVMPTLTLSKTVKVEPVSEKPGVVREQLHFGPLTLKTAQVKPGAFSMQMDPGGNVFYNRLTDFPKDISLLRTSTTIRDASGTKLGISHGIYNHHISVQDAGKTAEPLLSCPNGKSATLPVSSIAGVGEDGGSKLFTLESSPELSAFYVAPSDNIFFTAELVNNGNTTREVYAVLEIEYIKAKPVLDTRWQVVSVGQCDGSGLGVNAQAGKSKFAISSQPMTMMKDGTIFGLRGHLHDGGVAVTVKNNGKLICDSSAKYGGGGKTSGAWETISEMKECGDTENIQVKKGDNITAETSYDFDLHPARKQGDGMMAEATGLALFTFAAKV